MEKTDIIKLLKSKGEKVNNVSTLAIWESQFDDIADEILLQIKNHSDLSHVSVSDDMIESASEAYARERHPSRWDGEPWGEAGKINHRLAIKAALESMLKYSR